MQIESGTGKRTEAKVGDDFRFWVDAIIKGENEQATLDGRSYDINTGLITLTSAGESGCLYVKNNEVRDLKVTAIIVILGPSTGGVVTDTTRIRIYKNISTGTLVSGALDVDVNSNRNFGSLNVLDVDDFKGIEGATITDGTVHIDSLISPGNRRVFAIDEIIPKGKSIAVSYEPPDSNTSMKTMTSLICNLVETT